MNELITHFKKRAIQCTMLYFSTKQERFIIQKYKYFSIIIKHDEEHK